MDDSELVSVKLSELLRHPEDLDKLASLKAEFSRKKTNVDSQLKSGLQNQLEVTETGIKAIQKGQKTLNAIKEEMMRIDKLCAEAENMIQEFPLINKISKIHRNFVAVEEIQSNLQNLDTRLGQIDYMLSTDECDDLTAQMPNLLPIHLGLTQLRDFQDDVISQSEKLDDPDTRRTLETYFDPLAHTVDSFDERIGLISMSLIEIVRAGNHGLVVRLAKIVEAEERADERILALKEAQDNHQQLASRFKSMQKGAKAARGYKERFITCIKAAVESKFDNAKNNFEDDPESLPESLDWFFDDLALVRQAFPRLFPPKWKIDNLYLNIYHGFMHSFLTELIDKDDLDGAGLLTIIQWVGQYGQSMKALGIKAADLKPHVIDNREADLLREYTLLIGKKMEEWTNNVIAQEHREFADRSEEPGNESGKWHMHNVTPLFAMVNQNLNIALDSNKGSVVAGVVDEVVRILKDRQTQWATIIRSEVQKYTQAVTRDQQEEVPEGIVEYMMAIANDQIRSVNYVGGICDKVAPTLSKKYEDQIRAAFEDCLNGYIDLATQILSEIVEIIFNDLKPVTKQLFTPTWYEGNQVDTMVATIRSYVVDLQPGLDDELFPACMLQLAEKTAVCYLSAVHNKGAKFRIAEAVEQIRSDVRLLFEFFTEFMDRDETKGILHVLEYLLRLMSTSKEGLPQVYEEFKSAYWDLPMPWVEAVLKCREDKTRDMVDLVKSQATYTPRGSEATMMSRLAVS
ncbi:exocyst complex component Sec6 [Ascodesmis nigricans]|uniref:Exocyst complex component Sec6 n=1 Tax=Ascodesmis nigricans TaxID=341454 RepID=A0A4S2MX42_9PEZI|nr:exocyst complex component Sec6 [Ascodesmis nigricans]